MTSNGGGMGHLTRQLAVALAVGDRADAAMLSLSVALPIVAQHGLRGEYCPGHDRQWIPAARWQDYLRDRVVALAREIAATAIVFDGVAPFRGLLAARAELRRTAFVWMRRGMWRWGKARAQLAKSTAFDRVIEPGDLAQSADAGPTAARGDAIRIPPVTMLDVIDRLPRADAARALGIDPDRPTLLVTLGSGRHGEVEAPGLAVVKAALEAGDWQICVTTAHMAVRRVPRVDPARVTELVGVYPLVRYVRAFDAVVSAAGYNAVHEFIPAGLATLLVPNPTTRTDDQDARAHQLARAGLALCADPTSAPALADATARLLAPGQAERLAAACARLSDHRRSGGAAAAAELLLELARSPPRSARERQRAAFSSGKWRRPRPIRRVVRLLRPRPAPAVAAVSADPRIRVRVVLEPVEAAAGEAPLPLLFSDEVSTETLRREHPIEHLLTRSSAGYRAARRRIVKDFYDAGS